MEFRQLRYFIAIADQGSFSHAANRLHVSQPVLSRQIQNVENELEVTLFERSKRGVRLTYAGECYLEGARRLLADLEQLQTTAQNAHLGKIGILKIGVGDGFLWHKLVIRSIHDFRAQNPNVA